MNHSEYERFILLVDNELRRRDVSFVRNEAMVTVQHSEGASALMPGNYSVRNLAQHCKQSGRDDWAAQIARHFEKAAQLAAIGEQVKSVAPDYEAAQRLLRVRIAPPQWTGERRDAQVIREDIPGLDTVLCFDLPTAIVPVRKQYAELWPVSVETAFERGLANSLANGEVVHDEMQIAPGKTVQAFCGDALWHTAHALNLAGLVGPPGPYGVLVGIPHRHQLLLHGLSKGDVSGVLRQMARMVKGIHDEGPASVSPDLYWFIDGGFERIPTSDAGGLAVAMPPPTFVARVMRPLGVPLN